MVHLPEVDIDGIREQLAYHLFPIVKDKFITKSAHELAIKRTKEEYESCNSLEIGQRVNVRNGISRIPSYVRAR